jgi:hypothetical protein
LTTPAKNSASSTAAESSAERAPQPSATQVEQWIAELDSDEFLVREAATRELARCGQAAIEPLAHAARHAGFEAALRALGLLARFADDADPQTEQSALLALEDLAQAGGGIGERARRATTGRKNATVARLIELCGGATVWTAHDEQILLRTWRGLPANGYQIREIRLNGYENVNDDDAKLFARHAELEVLHLAGTSITDRGLERICKCKNLKELWLGSTSVSDAGLALLPKMPKLENLGLHGTGVTDRGLIHIRALPELRVLWLGSTAITNQGLDDLAGLEKLECLYLDGSAVTAGGLARLVNLKRLKHIRVRRAQLSAEVCEHLKAALPDLQIDAF